MPSSPVPRAPGHTQPQSLLRRRRHRRHRRAARPRAPPQHGEDPVPDGGEHGKKVGIAVMCPPDVYGPGAGPGNTQSAFTRFFIADATTLAGNRVFYTGAGTNTRFWVHISDLTSLYVRVVEAALADAPTFSGPGKYPGYYFASTQEHAHVDVARAIGEVLVTKGVIADAEPVEVGLDVVDRMAQHPSFSQFGRYMYAANARTRAVRAEKAFGYAGRAEGLLASQEVEVVAALGR
ncbi:hypothetical protein PMIN04_007741 [Paraphaeosphaeria minitans]